MGMRIAQGRLNDIDKYMLAAQSAAKRAAALEAAVASQQAVADEFARLGVLPRKVDVAPLWDRGFGGQLARVL